MQHFGIKSFLKDLAKSSSAVIRLVWESLLQPLQALPLVFQGLILGPVLLIIIISVYQWRAKQQPQIPLPINYQRIQYTSYHAIATNALVKFRALEAEQQQRLIENLNQAIVPFSQWLTALEQTDYKLLCLGESHTQTTRAFLAAQFFSKQRFDNLYLEATPNTLNKISDKLNSDTLYYPLLNADVLQLLRSVQTQNPSINIHPIEVSKTQLSNPQLAANSREDFITLNFWQNFAPEARNIVLIGAMHCSNELPWFYAKAKNKFAQTEHAAPLNVRVFSEHEEGPIEAFVYFLDELGFSGDLVISDTRAFLPIISQWFPLTEQIAFKPFQTVVIYRLTENNDS